MYLLAGSSDAMILGDYLYELFEECINADYEYLDNAANVAFALIGNNLRFYFEHSNGIIDWANNFDFKAVPHNSDNDSFYCHNGFLRVFNSAKPYIKRIIEEFYNSVDNITLVGYSHGAALAVLCHEYIVSNFSKYQNSIVSYGFGCPRVILGETLTRDDDEKFERFYVIRNLDDIVTHVPPSALGYSHVGYTVEIGRKGKYSSENSPDVNAHKAENYISELNLLKVGDGVDGIAIYRNH